GAAGRAPARPRGIVSLVALYRTRAREFVPCAPTGSDRVRREPPGRGRAAGDPQARGAADAVARRAGPRAGPPRRTLDGRPDLDPHRRTPARTRRPSRPGQRRRDPAPALPARDGTVR